MPAVSKAQQKFMGIVHAIQKGDAKAKDFSKDARDAAKSMSKKDAKDFASTKHDGLPDHVKKEMKEMIREVLRETFMNEQLQCEDCWKGYKAVGGKMKNGKMVPNCVPTNEVDTFEKDKEIASSLMKAKDMFEKALKASNNPQAKSELKKKLDDIDKIVKKMIQRKEGISEGSIPKMYIAYLGLQKKVRELEDKQKELVKPYLDAKDSNNVTAMNKAVELLKKNQQQLNMYRRNLDSLEKQYITNL
jgi:hypothetical protein